MQVSKCRKGYATDHEARPLLRGALLRWLWRTRFCFVFGTVYLLVAGLTLFREAPTTGPLADVNPMYFLFLRGIVTFSTLYNIWAGDRMHNLDILDHCDQTPRQEYIYWQHDELSISLIMTTTFILWSYNFSLSTGMGALLSAVMCGATCIVWRMSKAKTEKALLKDIAFGAKVTQGLMAMQFFFCLGWLVAHVLTDTNAEDMRYYTIIWFVYLPGILAFAAKSFNQQAKIKEDDGTEMTVTRSVLGLERVWGLHEVFHVSVMSGHATSAVMDLYFIAVHQYAMYM